MRSKLIATVAVSASLAGCYSLDDVRQGPVVWTATYETQFDLMANCLSGLYSGEYSVVPQFFQREQRANVVLSYPQGSAVLAEFEIRQTTGTTVEVSWRHMKSPPGGQRPVDRLSRERTDRCGRSA